MPVIKVIKTPAGEAPEEVRKKWVNALLVSTGPSDGREVGVLSDELIPRRQGFRVEWNHALDVLHSISPEAADWFRNHSLFSPYLVFGADEVVVIYE